MTYLPEDSTLTLKINIAIVTVASINATRARGSVMRTMGGFLGVIVFVLRDEFNAFGESEIWYVLTWLFKEQELWLVNASGCPKYQNENVENNQHALLLELAETQHLGEGLGEVERTKAVEEYLVQQVRVGDVAAWKIMSGEVPLEDSNSGVLRLSNKGSSAAIYDGCERSTMATVTESRPLGFKRWDAAQKEREKEATSEHTLRSRTASQRDAVADLQ